MLNVESVLDRERKTAPIQYERHFQKLTGFEQNKAAYQRRGVLPAIRSLFY